MSDSVWPHRRQPTRPRCPWDSPGKNTGVGCHFFFQCMKVKRESEVVQSCPTLSDPMDCSLPGSSIHGIFQARVPEWGAIAFSKNAIRFPQRPQTLLRRVSVSYCQWNAARREARGEHSGVWIVGKFTGKCAEGSLHLPHLIQRQEQSVGTLVISTTKDI